MKNKTIALLSIVAIALLAGCSPQDESKTVADLEKETAELREPISQPKTESDETPVDFKLLVARDGKQYIGDSDLPFSGIAVAWHENGQKKVEGTFKDGLGNGGFRDFHPNGQKWIEGTYKDGKREGIWSKWDEDGKKTMQSTFKDGVVIAERFLTPVDVNLLNKQNDIWFKVNSEIPFSGTAVGWHANGQKAMEISYLDGKYEGQFISWYSNGQKWMDQTYKDGKSEGIRTAWYPNGQQKTEGTWKDGEPEGIHTSWHENGQKLGEDTWKDGKEEGIWTFWDEDGKKIREDTYKDGELIKTEKFDQ